MSDTAARIGGGSRRWERARMVVFSVLAVLALLVVGILVWANTVMAGERPASLAAWRNASIAITSTEHSIIVAPREDPSGVGLVFIPGARVDPYAYMQVLSGVVETTGATVVITKPNLNLAFFDARPLSTFTADTPAVGRWFVGGHSLGGVRACQLAGSDDVAGLVLFASYCATDLAATELSALSISGSNDDLTTAAEIQAAADRLPVDTVFTEIPGANHASFGNYGVQPGDGEATITSAEARDAITDALAGILK
jgi:dienelactone hydrolase